MPMTLLRISFDAHQGDRMLEVQKFVEILTQERLYDVSVIPGPDDFTITDRDCFRSDVSRNTKFLNV